MGLSHFLQLHVLVLCFLVFCGTAHMHYMTCHLLPRGEVTQFVWERDTKCVAPFAGLMQ